MFASKEQEQYFDDLLKTTLPKLTKTTKLLRSTNYFFTITILLLSAALTVILGLNFRDNAYITQAKNIALIIGATITFLSGLKAFWKLETYWIRRKITLRRLEDLKDEFYFEKLSNDEYDIMPLFLKYQSIQNYSTIYWEDIYNEVKTDRKIENTNSENNDN